APFANRRPGEYVIFEEPHTAYSQSVSCTSGDSGTDSVTVHLEAGADVVCTFTNTALAGSVTIVKELIGAVPPADWAYTGDFGAFTIAAAGDSKQFATVAAGEYTVSETAVPGYAQSVSCTNGETGAGSVTFAVAPAEAITCTFVNTAQPGSITVINEVVGQTPPSGWAFTGDLGEFTLPAANGTSDSFTGLIPDDYTINETAKPGYTQAVACTSGESGIGSVTVNLAPGENTTCTFTNTAEPGTIFFVKEVVGSDRAEPWAFSGNLGDFATYAGNVEYFPGLPAGDYTITETAVDGYTPAAACDSGETGTDSITVALEPGEIVHCTFTNTAQPASITIVKETDPDGGTGFPFTLTLEGPALLIG